MRCIRVGTLGGGGTGQRRGRWGATANLYSFGAKGETRLTLKAVGLFRVSQMLSVAVAYAKRLSELLWCRFLFFGVQVQNSERLHALVSGF